jgi:transglycosylase-like protein with SLT domain
MKKLLILIVLCTPTLLANPKVLFDYKSEYNSIAAEKYFHKVKVLHTIIKIESDYDINAYNEEEDAVGLLQIRKIYVREVNRISGNNYKYTYADRSSPLKSIEMFIIMMNHYVPSYDLDSVACIHNSGGFHFNRTIKYRRNANKKFRNYDKSKI